MNIFDNLYNEKNTQQIIVVNSKADDSFDAELICYEKKNTNWPEAFDKMQAKIGEKGITGDKVEGDMKTPLGIYSFGTFFGSEDNIGFKFPYKKVDGDQFWVDDSKSDYYNTWQEGSSEGRWSSAENLLHPLYKYAAVINYNTGNVIKGKGSAIFFHKAGKGGTAGCVSLKEEELVKVLKWLEPEKNPVIVIQRKTN